MGEIAAGLVRAGRDPATPAAAVASGITPAQHRVLATLGDLPAAVAAAGLRPPVVIVTTSAIR